MSIRLLIRKSAAPIAAPVSLPSHRRLSVILLIAAIPFAHADSDIPATSADTQATEKPAARKVGETTTALLAAQADGSIAGPGLPVLGAAGNLSWQRYLDSFKYRIPETFANKINASGDE